MWRALAKYIPALVGLLFLYTGTLKLIYPSEPTGALESLEFSPGLAKWTIISATILELYLGIILLAKVDVKYGLGMATALMFVFTCYLFYLANMAHPPSCGCLGLTTGEFNSRTSRTRFSACSATA